MTFSTVVLPVLLVLAGVAIAQAADCTASDAALDAARATACSGFYGANNGTVCPNDGPPADHDWPSQATYMGDALILIGKTDPACLRTPVATNIAHWLNTSQADPTASSGFAWVLDVFQTQYFDMPRKPGTRIESPDTLGRKCWATAYLQQLANPAPAAKAYAAAGLSIINFQTMYDQGIPKSMALCNEVIANCFKNTTYTPSRNGTCPGDVFSFHILGFERENLKRKFEVTYPFYS